MLEPAAVSPDARACGCEPGCSSLRLMHGCCPELMPPVTDADPPVVDIGGMHHPVLLQAALPRPPNFHGDPVHKLEEPPVPIDFPVRVARFVQNIRWKLVRNTAGQLLGGEAGASKDKVVAISGPNTGGKTASLKTLGLAALMAKAGLFLPADPGARIAWFDRVLIDVGDGQSLQQNLSTFSGHIRNVRRILQAAGPQSLVLLDELGSGTDPTEGSALATAVLEQLQVHALPRPP
ncbi:hypothetical protein CYMTET_50174 [Cymbomonas tetramitiformis]|uniref:DNA mismatch repair proteins mutS family domain-containing protein n=1 Tax=Cymbomonas tetramitiformis TaxID=36881 RepID=A0AAE0ET39_9CHLO|nr:hypothetical protein CYMTET_50174 [Cymbomonas tetramitiformis]